jgi:L-lysine exporter family protein LysE/ArgO
VVRDQAWFLVLMTWGGAAFLGWYGMKAAGRAWRPGTLEAGDEAPLTLIAVVATLAAFTFFNPHVYLDTVLLLGGLGARHPAVEQPWFVLGASLASVTWFFGLAYGARLLAPLFKKAVTWRVLDGLIAAVMFLLAGGLVVGGLGQV